MLSVQIIKLSYKKRVRGEPVSATNGEIKSIPLIQHEQTRGPKFLTLRMTLKDTGISMSNFKFWGWDKNQEQCFDL